MANLFPIVTGLRTGTWMTKYILIHYHQALTGEALSAAPARFDMTGSLGADMAVLHGAFPYMEKITGPEKEKWKQLTFHLDEYQNLAAMKKVLAVSQGDVPKRMVYLYRNPFDHFVSMYDHAQQHMDRARFFTLTREDGGDQEIGNLFDFVKFKILDCYIKQRKSFELAKTQLNYPIMFVCYEDYIQETISVVRDIFKYFSFTTDERALSKAINESESENMKSKERERKFLFQIDLEYVDKNGIQRPHRVTKMAFPKGEVQKETLEAMAERLIANFSQLSGVSDVHVTSAKAIERFGIGGDQTTPDASHLRGGQIGKWRTRFTDEQVTYIQRRLDEHDISVHPLAYVPAPAQSQPIGR